MGRLQALVILSVVVGASGCFVDRSGLSTGDAAVPTDAVAEPDATATPDGCVAATETCDGTDQDCDGRIDEDLTRACGSDVGACRTGTETCVDGAYGDCDGAIEAVEEDCDGSLDEDCDGSVDEGCACTAGETRACGMEEGRCEPGEQACVDGVFGACSGVLPRDEICDGVDDDCDGTVDEGVTMTLFVDADGDGHGDPALTAEACGPGGGFASAGDDCNDACMSCHPGGTEICDGLDQDCDGTADDGVLTTYYADTDMDGHGDPSVTMDACTAPSGYVSVGDDCDDTCGDCFPGATETCDGVDEDCDGTIDETPVLAPSPTCPPPCTWAERAGHAYLFCRGAWDWASGLSHCRSLGYEYVRIDDSSEQTFVWTTATSTGTPDDWWIGLNDQDVEDAWEWTDGTALGSYDAWNTDQPDDGGNPGIDEDCVELNQLAGGAWNDLRCDRGYLSIICEAE